MGLRPLEIFLLLQCEDRLLSSESDVYRRQILTTKVYPRAVRVKPTVGLRLLSSEISNVILLRIRLDHDLSCGKHQWTCFISELSDHETRREPNIINLKMLNYIGLTTF